MLFATVIALIYSRELFDSKYDYSLKAKYLWPELRGPSVEPPFAVPDDVFRYYISPVHYNPMAWNCVLQGSSSSGVQHRLFQLCNEGIAARDLAVVLLIVQVVVLAAHGSALWTESRNGNGSWMRQRVGSEVDIAREGE
jgi:hypothetical protein